MALAQLNLKLPPEVLAHWRAMAEARGLSVRDWLIAEVGGAPAGAPSLDERVADLEGRLSALEQRPAVVRRLPRPAPSPAPLPVDLELGDLPAEGIETAALAALLGVKRGTFNARISRMGGPREGLEVDGWRCVAVRTPDRGGPARGLWVPTGT